MKHLQFRFSKYLNDYALSGANMFGTCVNTKQGKIDGTSIVGKLRNV